MTNEMNKAIFAPVAQTPKPSKRGRNYASGDEQGFGVLLGDGEEFEGGLPGAACALLPTAHGIGTDIQISGEQSLAGLQGAANLANFFWGNWLGPRRDARDTQVHGFASLISGDIKKRFLQFLEDVYFDFFGHEFHERNRPPVRARAWTNPQMG